MTVIKFLSIFLTSLLFTNSYSQKYEWSRTFGGTDYEYGYGIVADNSGNSYITGSFLSDTIDFDQGSGLHIIPSLGQADLFVKKVNPLGDIEWIKTVGGLTNSHIANGYSIDMDLSGNIYVTGNFKGLIDFDPGLGVHNKMSIANSFDCFILKLDNSGNFIWVKTFGGSDTDRPNCIHVDISGNILVTGSYIGTVDFDPSATTVANMTTISVRDIFVQKLNSNGNYIWSKSMGGNDNEEGFSITSDQNGNVYSTGWYASSSADFDPGANTFNLNAVAGSDVFISKLNVNGDYVWAKSVGGISSDEAYAISYDPTGNLFISGLYKSSGDFDPGPGVVTLINAGNDDIFIEKLDTNGNLIWANSIGSIGNEVCRSVKADSLGNCFLTGSFQQTVDFDPSPNIYNLTSLGSSWNDVFIQKIDGAGNLIWARNFGGLSIDEGKSITIDGQGNVLTTGYYKGTSDFNYGTGLDIRTVEGNLDIFVTKIGICNGTTETYSDKTCDSTYISPSGKYIWTSNGIYNDTIVNATFWGCDSVNTITLTFANVDTSLSITASSLISNSDSATYQWFDCTTLQPIIGETNQTFSPNTNGSYGVILIEDGTNCTDTSACYNFVNIGLDGHNSFYGTNIFPNPTSSELTINFKEKIEKIKIINITGNIVTTIFPLRNSINVSDLNSGIYFIKIIGEKNTTIQKFIKK